MSKLIDPKYRPSIKLSLISHIIDLAKSESPLSTASIELIGLLAPFLAKAEAGALQANPTPVIRVPKVDILESLGGEAIPAIPARAGDLNGNECWILYKDEPTHCSLKVIDIALDYAYTNDLMTSEEVIAYESRAMGDN